MGTVLKLFFHKAERFSEAVSIATRTLNLKIEGAWPRLPKTIEVFWRGKTLKTLYINGGKVFEKPQANKPIIVTLRYFLYWLHKDGSKRLIRDDFYNLGKAKSFARQRLQFIVAGYDLGEDSSTRITICDGEGREIKRFAIVIMSVVEELPSTWQRQ